MKPNIFDIAAKEFSLDAFVIWLLMYANDNNAEHYNSDDKLINQCAKEFISVLFNSAGVESEIVVEKIEAGKQWENIDVWAEINNKYLLIIENKTNSGQHSDQLIRYKTTAEDWCRNQSPAYESPICIYIKTGNESNSSLNKVREQGFSIFNRQSFIKLLGKYTDIKNQIFVDFRERLLRLEEANNNYSIRKIKEWESNDWVGFYQYLESQMDLVGWGYAANPQGGFWYAVINWLYWKGFPVYFQIEQGKLCFKIVFDAEEIDLSVDQFDAYVEQDIWQSILLSYASNKFKEIRRPDYYVHRGNYRTVAVVDREVWLGDDLSLLDPKAVINRLNLYQQFMKDVLASL